MKQNSESERYVDQAEGQLKSLQENIETLRKEHDEEQNLRNDQPRDDWEITIANVQDRLNELRQHVAGLKSASEEHWSDFQTKAERGFLSLRTFVQRMSETATPVLTQGSEGVSNVYYIQPSQDRGWELVKHDANVPTKLFENKTDAVEYSRRYVRDRRPSELIIRRRNGTFQVVHRYGT